MEPRPELQSGAELHRLGLAPGNRQLFDALIEHSPVGVFVADAQGACLYANARLCELTGLPLAEQLGYGWRRALHPDDVERVEAAWADAMRAGANLIQDQRFVRSDGTVAWIEMTARAVTDEAGRVIGWAGVCVDVTERSLSDRRYRELVENAHDAVYTADAAGNFISVNRAAEEISGYGREELLGMSLFDLLAPEEVERAQQLLARDLTGHSDESVEMQLVAKGGRRVFAEATYRVVAENGRPVRFEGIARDTTERHTLQEQLSHQAFHDPLTELPNRALLVDRLEHAVASGGRTGGHVAVVMLDLDHFKLLNDSLGHDVGDELLRQIAPRLLHAMRDSDTVARLGGDEFALVVESLSDEREVIAVAQRVMSTFENPFLVGEESQRVTASVGIALARPGDDAVTILRNADTAMYAAKARRRGGFQLFDDGMRHRLLRELELRNALAAALRSGELGVYYQPIVSLDDGEAIAVEALARWRHQEWGWVQPSEFVPIAEADELIVELDRYVLGEAVRRAAIWRRSYPGALPLGVFVNASPRQLATPDLVPFLQHVLDENGLEPTQLGIEVTERIFVDVNDGRIAANLAELTAMGVRLSLDDFGTGYSALASLGRFPFAALKIDRAFVAPIASRDDSPPISTAIVGLGKALGLTVIAEGVETDAQADCLRRLGCDAAQGYLYARPQHPHAVAEYLEAHPRAGRVGRRVAV